MDVVDVKDLLNEVYKDMAEAVVLGKDSTEVTINTISALLESIALKCVLCLAKKGLREAGESFEGRVPAAALANCPVKICPLNRHCTTIYSLAVSLAEMRRLEQDGQKREMAGQC
jgi:hypothetical protein